MRIIFILTLIFSATFATDLTIKSAGDTADGNGVSIQNSSSTELMIIEGDGDVSIDGTTLHVDAEEWRCRSGNSIAQCTSISFWALKSYYPGVWGIPFI